MKTLPLTKRSLALPADPAAVRLARSWVGDVLTEVGRPELAPGAKQAVSELVTNAILHADPPLAVRVRGTHDHPRVEVSDGSPRALRPARFPEDGDAINTFGRGLSLVAVNSVLWGWEHNTDGTGKTVWFEPAAEMHDDVDLEAVRAESATFARPATEPVSLEAFVPIHLRNMPARLFGELRRYHFELRRELRLLAFSDPDQYPLALRVSEVFARGDAERAATWGIDALDNAIVGGVESVDLHYRVPESAPATMTELLDLFGQVREHFADEQLLALTPSAVLVELQEWYFTEFGRQARGEEPLPWDGPTRLPDETHP